MLGAINLKRKKTQKAVLQRKRIIGKLSLGFLCQFMLIIRKLEECKNNAAEELHKALSIYSLKMDSQAR